MATRTMYITTKIGNGALTTLCFPNYPECGSADKTAEEMIDNREKCAVEIGFQHIITKFNFKTKNFADFVITDKLNERSVDTRVIISIVED